MSKEVLFDIDRLISCLIVIAVCTLFWYVASKLYYVWLKKIFSTSKSGAAQPKNNANHMLFSIFRAVIFFIAVISVMSIYGINITATVTGLGLASAVVGLALQDTLRDVFRGIGLMADKFYAVGDVIEYEGRNYEVMAFTLRATKMRNIDTGDMFTIFNGNISETVKLSGVQFIDVPLSYNEDYRYVNEVLSNITAKIEKLDGIIMCSYKGTQSFEDSAILYRIKIAGRQSDRPETRRAALRVIQEGLDEANLHIPFNQLDVHLDK